ncbi:hypothetical protein [Paenibacillus sp. MBLB4367]|uniref:hypothetical protein n=1 Tax=Paenibacillus sp. MBLB4367 TaxID=3384767 RepID=UPI003907EB4F
MLLKKQDLLERTSAACGFRWNSEVRKHYSKEVKEAKHSRMLSRKLPSNQDRVFISYLDEPELIKSHPLYPAIKLLNKFISKDVEAKAGRVPRVDELTTIIDDMDREIERLNQKLKEAKQAELAVTEDYMMLLRILERSRVKTNNPK